MMEVEDLNERIKELEKEKATLEKKFGEFVKKNTDPNPSWLIYLRDPLKNTGHWIFGIIRSLFYLLIFSGVIFASYFFCKEFYGLLFQNSTDQFVAHFIKSANIDSLELNTNQILKIKTELKQAAEEVIFLKSSKKDLAILSFIEHIFLYLIPLLVSIGFFFYFESNYKFRLLGSSDLSLEEISHSRSALNLTKTLFISSIMAYVIIKIIEKALIVDNTSIPDFQTLIIYLIFLFLLMSYLVLSHLGEHK